MLFLPLVTVVSLDNLLSDSKWLTSSIVRDNKQTCVRTYIIKHGYICIHIHTPWFCYCIRWPIKHTTWKMDRYPAHSRIWGGIMCAFIHVYPHTQSLSEGAAMWEYQGLLVFPISELFSSFLPLSLVTGGDGLIYSCHSQVITSGMSFVLFLLVGGMLQQGMRWMSEW